ncbi:MAG: preprotein translocase subunit SecG [Deltaproteobacteria bacterium]|jgi:preprotein translocase subunit SecG|nr:preprotein translocase subunit SecG [Deltaproteobacteria bacterium]
MSSFITFLHIVVAVILMISVLLQTSKGSGMGAAFGGSSGSVFGSRGPATLIARVTTVAAIIFMVTSLTLSVFAEGASKRGSVVVADPEPVASEPREGRVVSEEEAMVPPDPSLEPTPSVAETAPAPETAADTASVPKTATEPDAVAPAAGDLATKPESAASEAPASSAAGDAGTAPATPELTEAVDPKAEETKAGD